MSNSMKISVYVPNRKSAGTDDWVYITLYCEKSIVRLQLDNAGKNDFEPGSKPSVFEFEYGSRPELHQNPGKVYAVNLELKAKSKSAYEKAAFGTHDALQIDRIEIAKDDTTYTFPFFNTILGNKGDKIGDQKLEQNQFSVTRWLNVGILNNSTRDTRSTVYETKWYIFDNRRSDSEQEPYRYTETVDYVEETFNGIVQSKSTTDSISMTVSASGGFVGVEVGSEVTGETSTTQATEKTTESTISNGKTVEEAISVARPPRKITFEKHVYTVKSEVLQFDLNGTELDIFNPYDLMLDGLLIQRYEFGVDETLDAECAKELAERGVTEEAAIPA